MNTNGTNKKCSLYGGVQYIEVSARLNSYMYAMHSGCKSDGYNILFQSELEYCTGTTFRTRTRPEEELFTRTLPVPVSFVPVPYPYPLIWYPYPTSTRYFSTCTLLVSSLTRNRNFNIHSWSYLHHSCKRSLEYKFSILFSLIKWKWNNNTFYDYYKQWRRNISASSESGLNNCLRDSRVRAVFKRFHIDRW